jgi:hypothetical protein
MFNSYCLGCSFTLAMNINMDTTPYSAQQINSKEVTLLYLQRPWTDVDTATYCYIVPIEQVKKKMWAL